MIVSKLTMTLVLAAFQTKLQLKMNTKIIIAWILRATKIIVSKLTMVLVWGAFETKLQKMKKIVPRANIIVPTRDHVIFLGAFEPNEDCPSPCLIQFGWCLLCPAKHFAASAFINVASWIESIFKPFWMLSTFWRMSSKIFYSKPICEFCILDQVHVYTSFDDVHFLKNVQQNILLHITFWIKSIFKPVWMMSTFYFWILSGESHSVI